MELWTVIFQFSNMELWTLTFRFCTDVSPRTNLISLSLQHLPLRSGTYRPPRPAWYQKQLNDQQMPQVITRDSGCGDVIAQK